jgi:exoribonuclease II
LREDSSASSLSGHAGGLFASKEAALEAAVAALREKSERLPVVPDEPMELVEEAVSSAQEGRLRELTDGDWSRLRRLAHDVAARSVSGGCRSMA